MPHFWPFKNHWTCQKSCFLIRRGLKNLTSPHFFYLTFKMVIQRCFIFTPIFDHLKTTGHVRNHVFSSEEGLKKSDLPPWVLFCQTRVSNLQNGHREMLFFYPHFWPFKNHWTCQKSCFPIRRGLKKHFFLYNLPPEIRVSCQTFKMVIQRCFFINPPFLTI